MNDEAYRLTNCSTVDEELVFNSRRSAVYLLSAGALTGLLLTLPPVLRKLESAWEQEDFLWLIGALILLLAYTALCTRKIWNVWRNSVRLTEDGLIVRGADGVEREIFKEDVLRVNLETSDSGTPRRIVVVTKGGRETDLGPLEDLPILYFCLQDMVGGHRCVQREPGSTYLESQDKLPDLSAPEKSAHLRLLISNAAATVGLLVIVNVLIMSSTPWLGLPLVFVSLAIAINLLRKGAESRQTQARSILVLAQLLLVFECMVAILVMALDILVAF
ncbi:MAG: hypothetical protein HYV27_20325 [Candidatus Hydrogenedentes bacterium]|nr:hypothetical protein [Candidatus Hydrogenedentota bacterium]